MAACEGEQLNGSRACRSLPHAGAKATPPSQAVHRAALKLWWSLLPSVSTSSLRVLLTPRQVSLLAPWKAAPSPKRTCSLAVEKPVLVAV